LILTSSIFNHIYTITAFNLAWMRRVSKLRML